jgi:uncharacterized protein (TIGR04255 family)
MGTQESGVAKFSGLLRRPPIIYALCQVKFPTIGPIDEVRAEAMHAAVRSDYPYRVPQDTTEFSVAMGASLPSPAIRRSWVLLDRRKASGFILDSTSLIYRTTAYADFAHFVGETMRGVRGMLESLEPAVIERIGLRFVDLIEGQDAEDLPKFIEPPLYGFTPQVEGFVPQATQQFVRGQTPEGVLLLRYSRAKHGAALPPDLFDASLAGMRTPNSDRESVIIDIDHFRDNADLDPDPSQVQQLIERLQGPMSALFKSAVTPFAIEQWNTP